MSVLLVGATDDKTLVEVQTFVALLKRFTDEYPSIRKAFEGFPGQSSAFNAVLSVARVRKEAFCITERPRLRRAVFSFLCAQIDLTVEVGKLLTALQQERSEIAYFIFTNGTR